jgi:pleiotropic regulator 1
MSAVDQPPQGSLPSLEPLLRTSVKRTRALFAADALARPFDDELRCISFFFFDPIPLDSHDTDSSKARITAKVNDEYRDVQILPGALLAQQATVGPARPGQRPPSTGPQRKMIQGTSSFCWFTSESAHTPSAGPETPTGQLIDNVSSQSSVSSSPASSLYSILTRRSRTRNVLALPASQQRPSLLSSSLIRRKEARAVKPDYHPQWKLLRVISGHLGWVRSVAVEPGNQWFATGAGDRVIKVRRPGPLDIG